MHWEKTLESEQHSRIKEAIERGDYSDALSILANETDTESEVLYLRAVCQRRLGRLSEALSTLDALIEAFPKHGRAFQERGHVLHDLGQTNAALASFSRATQANPSLHVAWRAQAEILLRAGRIEEANRLKPQLERLLKMPKPLLYALDMLSQGFAGKAEKACRAFLVEQPHNVEGMRLLAQIATELNILDEAEFLLESAVLFDPDNKELKVDYVGILRKRQKLIEARDLALELYEGDKSNIHLKSQYAVTSLQVGDYEIALSLFDQLLSQIPGEPVTLTSKGHALKTIGRADAAIACYREACRDGVIYGEAWQSLANLKTYRFTEAEISRMEEMTRVPALKTMDRVNLLFALGKAYEDQGDYDSAFARYLGGNQEKRADSRYIAEHMTEEFLEQRRVFSDMTQNNDGFGAEDPIFIVGMPRAGSTLLEQILSSHSLVDGTQELPNILSIVQQLRNVRKNFDRLNYPRAISELDGSELSRLGQSYINGTRSYRSGAPYFIDKMPNNFRHIGLIKLILPNAKIIDARRHPLSCTFSCFKQLFAEGQEFSYDLHDLGTYYKDYVRLMDFWHECFPGEILHVQYEDVVDNLDEQVTRILDYCGLPFEEACLRYWETERAVKTPSSEQVRQPIFKSGVENWQKFDAHLDDLRHALEETLHNYRPNIS